MRKLTDFIINKRHFILSLFIVLTIISAIASTKVKINYDIAEYLPDTSETRIGMDIMEEEFAGTETSTLNLMFEDLADNEKVDVKNYLESIENVDSVDYDNTEDYNKNNYTLYVITVDAKDDSTEATDIYNKITEKYKDYTIYTSGDVSACNKTVLPFWIIALAVFCALIILIIMCESYVEPFLFLISILIAVVLNKGTNIMFDNVSNITNSIAAILQMALSMDYSIMLMNRYNQEKETEKDNVKAMKNALYKAFKAISSSSVTTIVGLLALVFMSFKIGKDLGFVLAKGVLFSLVCIFFVLPDLILMFDKWIVKSKKKAPNINLKFLGIYSFNIRYLAPIIFLVVFITSFMLKGNLGIDYTDSKSDEISEVFAETNQIAIIYKNSDEEKISKNLDKLENGEKVDEVLAYGNTINEKLTYDKLNDKLNDLGSDVSIEDYLLKILYYDFYNQEGNNTMTFNEFIKFIENEAYKNEKTNEKIDAETKKDVTRLKNFVETSLIDKKRTSKDIAQILEIDKSKIDDIFVYYLSKNNNVKLDIGEFINFMNKDVFTNEKYAQKVDADSRNKLNTLSKFVNAQTIQTQMNYNQMAELFGIDINTMNDLFKYYLLVNDTNIRLSIAEFSDFVLNTMINDSNYANNFDEATIQNIKLLSTFSNTVTISKQMSSTELANLFGIDEEKIKQILLLKYTNQNCGSKFSITEFINSTISLKNNTNFLDGVDISKLEAVSFFSQNSSINATKLNKGMLSQIFNNVAPGLVDSIYALAGIPDEQPMSPKEFIDLVIKLATEIPEQPPVSSQEQTPNNQEQIPASNQEQTPNNQEQQPANNQEQVPSTQSSQTTTGESEQVPTQVNEIATGELEQVPTQTVETSNGQENNESQSSELQGTQSISTISNQNQNGEIVPPPSTQASPVLSLDEGTLNNLKLLKLIIDDSITSEKVRYSAEEISSILGLNVNQTYQLYALITYSLGNTSSWTASPNEFVKIILSNKNLDSIKTSVDTATLGKLELLSTIMDSTLNNKTYTYQELSGLIGIDANNLKNIYVVYASTKNAITMSPIDFVNFVLGHKDDDMLVGKIQSSTISDLNLLQNVMNGILQNKKYNASELSSLLNTNKKDTDLLYGLYDSKYITKNPNLTLKEFVEFLLNDVTTNPEYSSNFDDDQVSKLKTVNGIMKNSLNNTKYTSDEIFAILSNLSNKVEKNTVEILYTYYGSDKEYNNSWEMTIEEFVNYLNDDILEDERFEDFIEDDMRKDIKDAKTTISDARELLIGKNYSRVVINTKFAAESPETFKFVQNIKDILDKNIDNFYIIGNSPMAYEMSKTFNNELNFMTIITMISIFIVVVYTFKSIIIPIILVLVIQCAVYLTMGILSFTGENVYFISILIVQSILMGATIDYAILYTTYYLENRTTKGIKESVINSYNQSINTILTSSSILIIVTMIIAGLTTAITAKICKTISEGTLCSTILILTLLPAVLAFWDKFIKRKQ